MEHREILGYILLAVLLIAVAGTVLYVRHHRFGAAERRRQREKARRARSDTSAQVADEGN